MMARKDALKIKSPRLGSGKKKLSIATMKSYKGKWDSFCNYAKNNGYSSLPASPALVQRYLSDEMSRGISKSTIGVSAAAISHYHLEAGVIDPTSDHRVIYELKILKSKGKHGRGVRPLTFEQVNKIADRCGVDIMGMRRLVILSLGWWFALSRDELAGLVVGDNILFDEKTVIVCKGKEVLEHKKISGILCPVSAVSNWCLKANIKNGKLLRSIKKGIVRSLNGDSMTGASVSDEVKSGADDIGLNCRFYAGDSLRKGRGIQLFRDADLKNKIDSVRKITGHRSYDAMVKYCSVEW